MNSKFYRCGYCGCPTDKEGMPTSGETFKRIVTIIEKYGDHHTEQVHGECCVNEQREPQMVQVTHDMAMDAGDMSLEGQWIRW